MGLEDIIKKIIEKSGLSRQEINSELQKQVDNFSGLIDEEGAIILVAKELGIDLKDNYEASKTEIVQKISELSPGKYASIVGRIIEISDKREYNKKDGGHGSLIPLIVQDKTGMIRCILWDDQTIIQQEESFNKHEIIRILYGLVKKGKNGGIEMHIGSKSRIELQPDEIDQKNIPSMDQNQIKITQIKDLNLNLPIINIEGRIGNLYPPKEFTRRTGAKGQRASLSVMDPTGSCYITFWNTDVSIMKDNTEGQNVRILNLSPKPNYKDKTKIDLTASSNTKIIVLDSNKNQGNSSNEINNISELTKDGGFGKIEGKVVEVQNVRTVNLKNGTQKQIQNFIIADETGAIAINLWEENIIPDLKINDSLLINGLMVKLNSYSNNMEGSLTRAGNIEKIKKQFDKVKVDIENKRINQSGNGNLERKEIKEITQDSFYNFKGTIVKDINRITVYEGCKKCYRKTDNCNCDSKGETENRMILNLILDDGTNTIRATLMGNLAEQILGEKTDRIKDIMDNNELDAFLQSKNLDLVGKEYIFEGKAKYSSYSETYEVNVKRMKEIDPEMEAQNIISVITK
jgi:replication factor A1